MTLLQLFVSDIGTSLSGLDPKKNALCFDCRVNKLYYGVGVFEVHGPHCVLGTIYRVWLIVCLLINEICQS